MYQGYVRYDGLEVVNEERLKAYLDWWNIAFYQCENTCPYLFEELQRRGWETVSGNGYISPPLDDAPWYDPYDEVSREFVGMALLEVVQADGGTGEVSVIENAGDGASITGKRLRSREIVVRALLLGASMRGANYGLAWLTTVLRRGDTCGKGVPAEDRVRGTSGFRLDFLDTCDFPLRREWRHMLNVEVLSEPQVLRRHEMAAPNCQTNVGQAAWVEIEFTLVGLNPALWHDPVYYSTAGADVTYARLPEYWTYYKGGDPLPTDDDLYEAPLAAGFPQTYDGLRQAVAKKVADMAPATRAATQAKALASPAARSFVTSPGCPALPGFPTAPQDSVFCGPPYTGEYSSVQYAFNANSVPHNRDLCTVLTLRPLSSAMENLRFRFQYGQPDGIMEHVGISLYIPQNALLKVDCRTHQVDLLENGVWKAADHLLTSVGQQAVFQHHQVNCPSSISLFIDVPTAYSNPDIEVEYGVYARDS